MHQVRPPEVGTGHLQLAPASCPLGHNFAFFIQKTHFQLEVFAALNENLVVHQPCRKREIKRDRRQCTNESTLQPPL